MNVDRLRQVRDVILAHPEQYLHEYWFTRGGVELKHDDPAFRSPLEDRTVTACIGGWACALYGMPESSDDFWRVSRAAHAHLALTDDQADWLMDDDPRDWPHEAYEMVHLALRPTSQAEAAVMAIDALIATVEPAVMDRLIAVSRPTEDAT